MICILNTDYTKLVECCILSDFNYSLYLGLEQEENENLVRFNKGELYNTSVLVDLNDFIS